MQRIFTTILLAAAIGGCAAQALTSGRVAIRDDSAVRAAHFSEQDRATIREFYRNSRKNGGKPVSAIVRNEPVPAALTGRALPSVLERRLSPLHAGVQRRVYGHDVALVQANTGLVLDVLYGVAAEP